MRHQFLELVLSQAKRTHNENMILIEWFREGCEFVEKVEP